MALGRRVAQRRTELDLSQDALARGVGMKQQGIDAIEKGRVARPRLLKEIAQALDTSQEWLLTGVPATVNHRGKKLTNVTVGLDKNPYPSTDEPAPIPEIDVRAGGGYGGGFAQEEAFVDERGVATIRDSVRARWGIPVPFLREELRARPDRVHIIPVRGDSMNDALFDGDRAIIDLDDTDISQGGIFALVDDLGSLIVKQVEIVRGGDPEHRRIRCSSRNKNYDPFELELGNPARIVGRVAAKITRL